MRNAIGTAPRHQGPIIIENEVTGASDIVSWSSSGCNWVKENGQPTEIKPTHWRPLRRQWFEGYRPTGDADRERIDFLVAQVSRESAPSARNARRLKRRWIALTTALGAGGLLIGAHSYLAPYPFIQTGGARLSEWRTTYQLAAASIFERKVGNLSSFEATMPRTEKGIARDGPRAEDGETYPRAATDPRRRQQEAALSGEHLDPTDRDIKTSGPDQDHLAASAQPQLQNADMLTSELNAIHHDLQTRIDQLAESEKKIELISAELRREQEKTAALSTELANARSDAEKTSAQASATNQEMISLRRANQSISDDLQQERQKTAALTNDAVELRQKVDLAVRAEKEVTEVQSAATEVAAELRAEQQKSAALESQLDAARRDAAAQLARTRETSSANASADRQATSAIEHRSENTPPTSSISSSISRPEKTNDFQASSKFDISQQRPATEPSNPEATRLIARANNLLLQGNITQARTVLDRAAQMGSAQANFAIAETYDPHVLANWKTVGTRPDIAAAREYYSRAATGGVAEATDRLNALP